MSQSEWCCPWCWESSTATETFLPLPMRILPQDVYTMCSLTRDKLCLQFSLMWRDISASKSTAFDNKPKQTLKGLLLFTKNSFGVKVQVLRKPGWWLIQLVSGDGTQNSCPCQEGRDECVGEVMTCINASSCFHTHPRPTDLHMCVCAKLQGVCRSRNVIHNTTSSLTAILHPYVHVHVGVCMCVCVCVCVCV